MVFWISAIVLSFLASGLVWRAWTVRLREGQKSEISDTNLYETTVQEIERDLNHGKMGSDEAEAAKAEAVRQLIRAKQSGGNDGAPNKASGWWMTIALVFIPFASVALYSLTGNPPPIIETQEAEQTDPEMSLEQLVAVVEQRLEEFPDDANGWRVIAPVYVRQQRFEKAEIAFRNILRIEGDSPDVLSGLGEIIVERSEGAINDRAIAIFERAIALDGKNNTARFYLGEAAFQSGDKERAAAYWQQMVDDAQGNEDWLPGVRNKIAGLGITSEEDGDASDTLTQDDGAAGILALPEEERLEQINAMVEGLAARLEADPDDKEGWVRLVRSYMVLGRSDDAQIARDNAKNAFSDDQEFLDEIDSVMKELSARE